MHSICIDRYINGLSSRWASRRRDLRWHCSPGRPLLALRARRSFKQESHHEQPNLRPGIQRHCRRTEPVQRRWQTGEKQHHETSLQRAGDDLWRRRREQTDRRPDSGSVRHHRQRVSPLPEAQGAIVNVDIVGTAASARVDTNDISGFCFTDFFNLLKVEGQWAVVSKIYHTHVAP
ncbi:nuclear transport factor 2 family protein [Pseudomonas sp. R4-39-08]|uniref:nuclear transport factor 2 family protein n=1 Tax=Pseudomonas sp. R4-39-08 TaxID=1173288 RepID=UPI00355710B9